jgi:nitrogen fixation/metabolism regulation signal transduction histidine kinase
MPKRFRRSSYATRLFIALFLLSAVPSLALLGAGTWAVSRYVALTGSLGPWSRVAETGRVLLEELEPATASDSALARAAQAHREELSHSVALSRRFELLGGRVARALPWIGLTLWVLLVGLWALWIARKLAGQMSKPVAELVGWADRIARDEPLPPVTGREEKGAPEFRSLRDAFRSMADRLAEGRARALEAERLRTWTELARRVAHELKNSLTPLRLAVARLERRAPGVGDEELRVIVEESDRLEEMARSFAQLGRLPEGPVSEVDLGEMLAGLVHTHVEGKARARVRVADDVPFVRGHYEALSRVFRNLILNAVEAAHGRPDPEIRISVEREDAVVRVHVADSGSGIDAAIVDRIWEPDFTTKSRGTGLGLALVRQTVRAHGGDVEVQNVAGGGADFIVSLPIAPAPAPALR